MILDNYAYNAIGGVDAERTLESGEIVKYTLTSSEAIELTETVLGSHESAKIKLDLLRKASKSSEENQAVNYSELVSMMTKELQELRERVNQLEL